MVAFCEDLSPREWGTGSAAEGWRIQDVVAHIGSGCHAMFGPGLLTLVTSRDIEKTNDSVVADRRDWHSDRILREYRRWSARMVTAAAAVCRTPLRRIPIPLAELGRFPIELVLCGAMVFDHHTHLRHDMAPALHRPAPDSDANRMAVVLAWMFAVLQNQLSSSHPDWLDRPVGVILDGPGGGRWIVDVGPSESEDDLLASHVETWITAQALDFPEWGTGRARWTERDVTIMGDQEYGAAFLDTVNVV